MHDIKQIRENRDAFVAGLTRRASAFDGKPTARVVDDILELDNRWRAAKIGVRAAQGAAERSLARHRPGQGQEGRGQARRRCSPKSPA